MKKWKMQDAKVSSRASREIQRTRASLNVEERLKSRGVKFLCQFKSPEAQGRSVPAGFQYAFRGLLRVLLGTRCSESYMQCSLDSIIGLSASNPTAQWPGEAASVVL